MLNSARHMKQPSKPDFGLDADTVRLIHQVMRDGDEPADAVAQPEKTEKPKKRSRARAVKYKKPLQSETGFPANVLSKVKPIYIIGLAMLALLLVWPLGLLIVLGLALVFTAFVVLGFGFAPLKRWAGQLGLSDLSASLFPNWQSRSSVDAAEKAFERRLQQIQREGQQAQNLAH